MRRQATTATTHAGERVLLPLLLAPQTQPPVCAGGVRGAREEGAIARGARRLTDDDLLLLWEQERHKRTDTSEKAVVAFQSTDDSSAAEVPPPLQAQPRHPRLG